MHVFNLSCNDIPVHNDGPINENCSLQVNELEQEERLQQQFELMISTLLD